MKKANCILLSIVMLLTVIACSTQTGQTEYTWQEQYNLGVRYLSEGNYEEAIIAFQAAIEIDPKQVGAYIRLADTYLAMNNSEMAIITLTNALEAVEDTSEIQGKLESLNDNSSLRYDSDAQPENSAKLEPDTESAPDTEGESSDERFENYIIDYIGLTVNDVADMWGEDFQYVDDLLWGAARPFYYPDVRIPFALYFLDSNNTGKASGEERIMMVEFNPNVVDVDTFAEIAPDIPLRVNATQLAELGYKMSDASAIGDWEFGATSALCLEYSTNIEIYFFWFDSKDSNTIPAGLVLIWERTL